MSDTKKTAKKRRGGANVTTRTKNNKADTSELPRYVPGYRASALTGVYYAELQADNRTVDLVYTNGVRISAIVSDEILNGGSFFAVVEAVEDANCTLSAHFRHALAR